MIEYKEILKGMATSQGIGEEKFTKAEKPKVFEPQKFLISEETGGVF